MKQRHVSFTRTAQRHVAQEQAWWLENRDYPEVFVEELESSRSSSKRSRWSQCFQARAHYMPDRRSRAYAGSFLDVSPSTSITPSMTTSSSSVRCGAHDESVVLSSSLDGNSPPLTTCWRECWLHAVYAPLRHTVAIGITVPVFRRAPNARRIPSSTESNSLAKSSAR